MYSSTIGMVSFGERDSNFRSPILLITGATRPGSFPNVSRVRPSLVWFECYLVPLTFCLCVYLLVTDGGVGPVIPSRNRGYGNKYRVSCGRPGAFTFTGNPSPFFCVYGGGVCFPVNTTRWVLRLCVVPERGGGKRRSFSVLSVERP